jgi:hypothetical protein
MDPVEPNMAIFFISMFFRSFTSGLLKLKD